MGYDLYFKKVNKKELQKELIYFDLKDLSYDIIQRITEDEVDSFLNIFEKYFSKNNVYYRYDDYFELSISDLESMMKFLKEEFLTTFDANDYYYKESKTIYDKISVWKDDLDNSVILFEHDC